MYAFSKILTITSAKYLIKAPVSNISCTCLAPSVMSGAMALHYQYEKK